MTLTFEHFNLVNRLHSDVLEDKYGPIRAEVLRHDDEVREAHLVDEKGVSRTYALTFFPKKFESDEVRAIDQEIREGALIGKAFRAHNFEIRKNVVAVYAIELPRHLMEKFGVKNTRAKARLAEFYIRRGQEKPMIYGIVVEIYSPDFRPAIINKVDREQVVATTEALTEVHVSREEIWDNINEHKLPVDKLRRAKELGASTVARYRKLIEKYLLDASLHD